MLVLVSSTISRLTFIRDPREEAYKWW